MHGTLELILILLAVAVPVTMAFRRWRLPSLLAYLLIGMAVGPQSLGWVPNQEDVRQLAEFGVVFLMFSIGLEFNLQKVRTMGVPLLGMGGLQVLATTGIVVGIAVTFGLPWQAGVALGGALAMSSTAIVSKMLVEQSALRLPHGQQAMALLLFQDMAVVPLLILIPALSGGESPWAALGASALKATLVLFVILVLGRRVMGGWLHAVARPQSPEIFVLNVLLVTLGLAYLTAIAGLSLALGAFVAGMLIAETPYRYQVEADIQPFRDILLGLFFVTLGMLLDLETVGSQFGWVLAVAMGIIAGKAVLITTLARLFRTHPPIAIRTGLWTAQAGEFSLVLLSQAGNFGVIPATTAQIALAGSILSMLLAPLLIQNSDRLARLLTRQDRIREARQMHRIAHKARDIKDHVIICGFGRSGHNVAGFLEKESIPFLALDLDPQIVKVEAAAGAHIAYGNAGKREVLLAAGVEHCRAVVITHVDIASVLRIIGHLRDIRPEVPVVVRTTDDHDLEQLRKAGATEVVPEIIEGSLMLASQTLLLLQVPHTRVLGHLNKAREQRYQLLRTAAGERLAAEIDIAEGR